MPVEQFKGDLSECAGEILAAWFIANPNGPTAFAVGFLEQSQKRTMFYRWMHFSGGRTWIAGDLEDETAAWEGDYGHVLLNNLLLLNNYFLAHGGETVFLKAIPNIILTNSNPDVVAAFGEFLKLCTVEEDWGRQIYYVEKYGHHFFESLEEEYRDIYEAAKARPDIDPAYLRYLEDMHGKRAGFKEWQPDQYVSHYQTDDTFIRWYEIVTGDNYSLYALYEFAQMWVGACAQQKQTGLLDRIRIDGRFESLDDVLSFFSDMNMPLLPPELTERAIAEKMGLEY